jgi:hypothetical protein
VILTPATNAKYPAPGIVSTMIWCTDRMPAEIDIGETPEDMGARVIGTPPPPNGTRFAVITSRPATPPSCTARRPSIT